MSYTCVIFCSSIPVCSVIFCSSIPVCSVCAVSFVPVYQTLHSGVHRVHTACAYIQLYMSQSISCAGQDEAPKIVRSEEPVEGGRKEPSLEELEVPESTPLAGIPPVPPSLPLSFDVGVGVRLVNAVRSLTGISHSQSISAAEATLRFVGTEVSALSDTMDALIVALAASKVRSCVSVTHWFIQCLSLTGLSSVYHSLVHPVFVTCWLIQRLSLTGSSCICHSLVHSVSVTHWFIQCLSLTGSSSVCRSLVHSVSVTHWFIQCLSLTGSSSVCRSLVHSVSVTHWFIQCLSLTGSSCVSISLIM